MKSVALLVLAVARIQAADVNAILPDGTTELHWAVREDNVTKVDAPDPRQSRCESGRP